MSRRAAGDVPAGAGTGPKRWFGLAVVVAALGMVGMDATIVGISMPVITRDLHLDLTEAPWVTSLYSVTLTAFLLSTGRFSDRFGRRRLLIIGVVVFVGGSILASLADTGTALISARVVQAIGGALVLPCTLSTINATFRGKDRATAFGIWGAMISIVAAIGPLLGGWLTTSFTWPWIFLINVPIGVLVIAGAAWAMPNTRAEKPVHGLDVGGLLLSAVGFGLFVFALVEGSDLGWWTPRADFRLPGITWPTSAAVSPVPVFGALGMVLLVSFVFWERHRARVGRTAVLNLKLFLIDTFSWGAVTTGVVATGEYALIFVLPLFLVSAFGLSTLNAGVVLAGMAFGALLSGALARKLVRALGAPQTVMLGLAIEVVGVTAVAVHLAVGSAPLPWVLTVLLAIYGVGLGLASAQLPGTVLFRIPSDESGQGSAALSTARHVGGALGAAATGVVLSLSLATTIPRALKGVVSSETGARLAGETRSSSGQVIDGLRREGSGSRLGPKTDEVVDVLSEAFADATAIVMGVAAVVLVVGLVASIQVARAASRDPRVA